MDVAITYEVPAEQRRTVIDSGAIGGIRDWLAAGRGITLWVDREITSLPAGNRVTPGDGRASHWRFGCPAFHIDDIVVCQRGAELAQRRGMPAYRWRVYEDRGGRDVAIVYNSDRDDHVAYAAVFTPLSKYLTQEQNNGCG